jgi:hypothetical protein
MTINKKKKKIKNITIRKDKHSKKTYGKIIKKFEKCYLNKIVTVDS